MILVNRFISVGFLPPAAAPGNHVYLGGRSLKWVADGRTIADDEWTSGQPDTSYECTFLWASDSFTLHDSSCDYVHRAWCQREADDWLE